MFLTQIRIEMPFKQTINWFYKNISGEEMIKILLLWSCCAVKGGSAGEPADKEYKLLVNLQLYL